MRKLFMLAICGLSLLALGSPAQAVPISGEIHFVGLWNPTGGAGVSTATGIDFTTSGLQIVLAGTGDFAGLTGVGATFADFTFAPFAGPLVPLWSLPGGQSFDLTAVVVTFQSATQLDLRGSGILHAPGLDDTPADWDFTGNSGSVVFSFSADNVAVPEPTTVGLLAVGLVGLTAAGNKKARSIA